MPDFSVFYGCILTRVKQTRAGSTRPSRNADSEWKDLDPSEQQHTGPASLGQEQL